MPYRTPCGLESTHAIATTDRGARFAFGVMAFAGAVEVVVDLPRGASVQTLFGVGCVLAGLAWLRRS